MSVDPDCLISLIAEYEKAGLSKPEAISKATQYWHYMKKYAEDKRPPKEWWDACYKRVKSGNPKYTDEQIRKTCGEIWHKRGVRKVMGKSEYSSEDLIDIVLYTIESTGMKDCVPKMISHLADAHPKMPNKQRIAVAHAKCRKKHGIAEPDRD